MSSLAFLAAEVPAARPRPQIAGVRIVGISGPPGCGKTTLAESLCASQHGNWRRFNRDRDGPGFIAGAAAHLEAVRRGGGRGGAVIDMCMATPAQRVKIEALSADSGVPLTLVRPTDQITDLFARSVAGVVRRGANHESLGTSSDLERARVVSIFCSQLAKERQSPADAPKPHTVHVRFNTIDTAEDATSEAIRALLGRIDGNFDHELSPEDVTVLSTMLERLDVHNALQKAARPTEDVLLDILTALAE